MKKTEYDNLTNASLRVAMGAAAERFVPYAFDKIDSTNSEAKRRALAGERYALIAADRQTAGRGRMGRAFASPDRTGAYFSILYTPSAALSDAVSITSATAVAVMRAIGKVCNRQTEIKWVNDLFFGGKKVCGILAESVMRADGSLALIIGIGINLRGSFAGELADIAGALDTDAERATLIAAVLGELTPYLDDSSDRTWLMDYKRCSCVLGREIEWRHSGSAQSGRAVDIDEDGALLVRASGGETVRLSTGEISLRVV